MAVVSSILVPTDFSDGARAALREAISFGVRFGAEIHLLHAYDLSVLVGIGESVVIPQTAYDRVREAAQRQLEELAETALEAGVPCKIHLVQGRPTSVIEDYARSLSADLIVMGTRGATGLDHILLGSVAERTVRAAPCPVLVVPEGKA